MGVAEEAGAEEVAEVGVAEVGVAEEAGVGAEVGAWCSTEDQRPARPHAVESQDRSKPQ